LSIETFVNGIKKHCEEKKCGLTKLVVGQENHEGTEGKHLHVYMGFCKKLDTQNVRYFDAMGEYEDEKGETKEFCYHPNWKKFPKNAKGAVLDWIYYCMKYGKYHKEGFMPHLWMFKNATNFIKKMADHEAWMRAAEDQALEDPFPFKLPDGTPILKEGAEVRKRHWIILGPPDCGKTWWLNKTFAGKKVFSRPKGVKTPFEAALYHGEELIIYDDVVMPIAEIIAVTDTYYIRTHVYGSSRYHANFWPLGKARTVIWVLNPSRLPDWAKPGDKNYSIFQTRFNVMERDGDRWIPKEHTVEVEPDAERGAWINREGHMEVPGW